MKTARKNTDARYQFEADLSRNLYKLWNRLSSGSYLPPPVRQVGIPKKDGGVRILGVPTVADRIAQQVVVTRIGGDLYGVFHPDSYGYQLGKSAVDAVAATRKRCWAYDWVVEFDIRRAFDELDWGLLRKAIAKHVKDPWCLLYFERWLTASAISPDGQPVGRIPRFAIEGGFGGLTESLGTLLVARPIRAASTRVQSRIAEAVILAVAGCGFSQDYVFAW